MQHRRVKQSTSFNDRLKTFADELRAEASGIRPGPERDALLRRTRQADTARRLDSWANSPELQLPKWSPPMKDMREHLEKLQVQIAECEMIRDLATDPEKRELFTRLALHFKTLAGEIEAELAKRAHWGTSVGCLFPRREAVDMVGGGDFTIRAKDARFVASYSRHTAAQAIQKAKELIESGSQDVTINDPDRREYRLPEFEKAFTK
jgi:hypothetical protein